MSDVSGISAQDMLNTVNNAINAVLVGGQSYQIGSRKLTRADLKLLYDMQNDLSAQVVQGRGSLLDDTYVAVFDGR